MLGADMAAGSLLLRLPPATSLPAPFITATLAAERRRDEEEDNDDDDEDSDDDKDGEDAATGASVDTAPPV